MKEEIQVAHGVGKQKREKLNEKMAKKYLTASILSFFISSPTL